MASNDPSINVFTFADEIVNLNNIPLRFSLIEADIPKIKRYHLHLIHKSYEEIGHSLRKIYDLKLGVHCSQIHNEQLGDLLQSPNFTSDENLLNIISQFKEGPSGPCQGCSFGEKRTLFSNGFQGPPLRQCRDYLNATITEYNNTLADHLETAKKTLRKYELIISLLNTDFPTNAPPPLFSDQKPLLGFFIDELTNSIVGCVHIWWSHGYSANSPLIIEFDLLNPFKDYRPELIYYSVNAIIRLTTIDGFYEKLEDPRLLDNDKFIVFIPVMGCTTDWRAIRQIVFDRNIGHEICTARLPTQMHRLKI